MNFLVIFTFSLATVSAFDLHNPVPAEGFISNVAVPVDDGLIAEEAEGFIPNIPSMDRKENILNNPLYDAAKPDHSLDDKELMANKSLLVAVDAEDRITNGQLAWAGQFPYQAYLSIQRRNSKASCGAVLIGKNWLLTAAHCTYGARYVTVHLGSIVRKAGAVKYIIYSNNIINHPWYANMQHDISLIRIPTVTYSANIQPVRLPTINGNANTYTGSTVIASGWGQTESSRYSKQLRWARMKVISNAECSKTYLYVASSIVCISTYGGVSPCFGDSGGPLVLESSNTLIGISSFVASSNCVLGDPAAFTRVTSYLDWIKQHTGIYY